MQAFPQQAYAQPAVAAALPGQQPPAAAAPSAYYTGYY